MAEEQEIEQIMRIYRQRMNELMGVEIQQQPIEQQPLPNNMIDNEIEQQLPRERVENWDEILFRHRKVENELQKLKKKPVKESKPVIHKEEECIINFEELADYLATEFMQKEVKDFSFETHAEEYNKQLERYTNIIKQFKVNQDA